MQVSEFLCWQVGDRSRRPRSGCKPYGYVGDREPLVQPMPRKGFVPSLVPVGSTSFCFVSRRVKPSNTASDVVFDALRSDVGFVHDHIAKNLKLERL